MLTDDGHQVMAKVHIASGKVSMFSIKIAHFVPISLQTWPPQEIIFSDWSISKNLLL
jgi:hypothetical protein